MTKSKRMAVLFPALSVIAVLSVFAALAFGSAKLDFKEILAALFTRTGDETTAFILFELRLPRVLAAALAGAGLAVSGLLLQTVTDNDLCSPSVLGINSGAGLAVMITLSFFPAAFAFLPLAAFAGAAATTLLVLGISFASTGRRVRTKVVLAGVAVGALLSAGINFLAQIFPDTLASYSDFSTGGFRDIYLGDVAVPGIAIAAGIAVAFLLSGKLNVLQLGEDIASGLGVAVKPLRFFTLLLASLLCGCVVSFAGLLGFAGLIVPHIARRLVGHDMRLLIPASVLCGPILVILADLAARTLFAPTELPAGILLAVLGAPFFLYLLFRRKQTL